MEVKVFNMTLNGTMSHDEIAYQMSQYVNGPNGQDWIPVIKDAVPLCIDRAILENYNHTVSPYSKSIVISHCDEKAKTFFECMKEQQYLV